MIIIAKMVKLAFEVNIRKGTSKSTIRNYLHNIFVFVFFLGVLPTIVAHPSPESPRARQCLLDPEPCRFQQLHLHNLHRSKPLKSNLNIHNSIFIILALHLYIRNVHALSFSYLKTIHLFLVIQPFVYTIAHKGRPCRKTEPLSLEENFWTRGGKGLRPKCHQVLHNQANAT